MLRTSVLLGYYCNLLLRNYGNNHAGGDNSSILVSLGRLPLGKKKVTHQLHLNMQGKLLRLSCEKSQGSWLERHYVLHWTLFGPLQNDSQEYTFYYYTLPRTKQWLWDLLKTLQICHTVTKSHWHRMKFALPVHLSCFMAYVHEYESLGETWGSHAFSSACLFAPCSRPSLSGNNLP